MDAPKKLIESEYCLCKRVFNSTHGDNNNKLLVCWYTLQTINTFIRKNWSKALLNKIQYISFMLNKAIFFAENNGHLQNNN